MRVKYLGTAAAEGIPAMFCACELCERAKRLGGKDFRMRSQMLIDGDIMVDFGPDVYYHSIKYGFNLSQIKYLLITHTHSDHWIPAPLEYRLNGFSYKHIFEEFYIVGNEKVAGDPVVNALSERIHAAVLRAEPFSQLKFSDLKLTPLPAAHMSSEQALLYLIERGGKSVLYLNDTGIFSEETDVYLKGAGVRVDLVSLDCTKGDMFHDYYTHMSMEECNSIKQRFLRAGICGENTRFIITHFSHNCKKSHAELESAAEKYGFLVAYDGMEIEI